VVVVIVHVVVVIIIIVVVLVLCLLYRLLHLVVCDISALPAAVTVTDAIVALSVLVSHVFSVGLNISQR
jgi:hypothetical protein